VRLEEALEFLIEKAAEAQELSLSGKLHLNLVFREGRIISIPFKEETRNILKIPEKI